MKDIHVVGKKWPEMIVKLPNAKVVTFECEQTTLQVQIQHTNLINLILIHKNFPVWFEYKWDNIHGTTHVVKTNLKKSNNHDFVYHALFGNTVKFFIPTISLMVFSILIIREV